MSSFSKVIADFWNQSLNTDTVTHEEMPFQITISSGVSEERSLMILETTDGRARAALSPGFAEILADDFASIHSIENFRLLLAQREIELHGADFVFYFSESEKEVLQQELHSEVRKLVDRDLEAFKDFTAAASAQDLDDAFVEFDHWAVFGAFKEHKIAAAASMYPWSDARIADMGVLTLAQYRGQGHARKLVRAISRFAIEQGYEPQYRCQTDNSASIALAKSAGLSLFGKWQVAFKQSYTQPLVR